MTSRRLVTIGAALTTAISMACLMPTGAADGSSALRHHPRLISFKGSNGFGIEIRPSSDLGVLRGTSHSFKRHVRRQLADLLAEEPAEQQAECANAPVIVVQRYRTDGWAYISDFGDFPGSGAPDICAGGGALAVWHRTHDGWRTVVVAQEDPTCRHLSRLGVPADVWHGTCYRDNNLVDYHG